MWYERLEKVVADRRGGRIIVNHQEVARADVLRDQLATALTQAVDVCDERAVGTLRLVLAAINERDHCARQAGHHGGISEDAILTMLRDMVEQRRAEIDRCESGARLDLAEQEEREIAVLEQFLPAPLTAAETKEAVEDAILSLGATRLKDMGPVLNVLKERYNGTMDVGLAKEMLCARLS